MRYFFTCCLCIIVLLASCNSTNTNNNKAVQDNLHAKGFSVTHHNGYTVVEISNPWKSNAILQRFTLVPSGATLPDSLPDGAVIRTPVKSALVYSAVHANAIKELGHLSSITGVCDAQYFTIPEITSGVADGTIINAGSSMAPVAERIIALSPDIVLLSPYQNSGYAEHIPKGIPIVECADYMESSPLGRAEWIKLFGLLFNEEQKADSIYSHVVDKYTSMKKLIESEPNRPKILSENIINGTWYVPGGNSYMAQMFADAGGSYAWSDVNTTGSIPLDMAQVLSKAHDADVWLIKSFDPEFSYSKLKAQHALNEKFKAFTSRNVYYCDTERTTLFQDFPFHPEFLLQEYIAIFHPHLADGYSLKYFKPLADE